MSDLVFVLIGVVMLAALVLLAGSVTREDHRMRRRWEARFERDARELRRTDATGVLMCRRCGSSGSEKAGVCPRCGATL